MAALGGKRARTHTADEYDVSGNLSGGAVILAKPTFT